MAVYNIPDEAASQMTEMRFKFNMLDKNKDGMLDFDELKALLKQGNPNITAREVRALFNSVDKNKDGKIEFSEFLLFIFSSDDLQHVPAPPDVVSVYQIYAGGARALDGRSFAKLVRDCHLLDRTLFAQDVDIIFDKVRVKGERKIGLAQFEKAVVWLADRKGWRVQQVMEAIGDANGPLLQGTKADSVRFHDDKGTYTGISAHTDGPSEALLQLGDLPASRQSVHSGRKRRANNSRCSRRSPIPSPRYITPRGVDVHGHGYSQSTQTPHLRGEEGSDWARCQDAFYAFSSRSGDMDVKEFAKLCQELRLLGRGFTSLDIDLVFSKACDDGKRRIGFHNFQDALRDVADRRR